MFAGVFLGIEYDTAFVLVVDLDMEWFPTMSAVLSQLDGGTALGDAEKAMTLWNSSNFRDPGKASASSSRAESPDSGLYCVILVMTHE